MKDFILEIYSEEIPARMQKFAEENFYKIFENFFREYQIRWENLQVNVGPCRIIIQSSLAEVIPAKIAEIKGPKIDANEQAILGFCRANKIQKEQLTTAKIKDQDFYFYINHIPEQLVKTIIEKNLVDFLNKMIWPKSMVWEEENSSWVRPIRSILCLLDQEVIKIHFGNIASSHFTYGHKFMSHKKIEISDSRDYLRKLHENNVIINRAERQNIIMESLLGTCTKLNITLNSDEKLLEEVTGLAEYPVILYGKIDNKFVTLPPEVLITSMRHHQKYFTASDSKGNLAPYFLFVTNLKLDDYSEIIAGNERVLSARLSDALYFYNTDQTKKLESNNEKLKEIIFHTKIGTMYDKTLRIEKLCTVISDNSIASKAAKISKSDLVTEMVGEFPELQGIMGGYYANKEGYDSKICAAIKHHYKPMGAEDETPRNEAAILSIADKIDSLVALYYAGERATGSKDPYALRRYALGIIRTILDNQLTINLHETVQFSLGLLGESSEISELTTEILLFIEERFKQYLKQEFSHDIINACVDLSISSDLSLSYAKIIALSNALKNDASNLISLYKRVKNIIGPNINKEKVKELLFQTSSEQELYNKIIEIEEKINFCLKTKNFAEALSSLQQIEKPLALFFEENLVNSENTEVTENRMAMLSASYSLFSKLANFDSLE